MLAEDIMTADVVSVGPGHSIVHAVQIMLENNVSGLAVLADDGSLAGLLTEGDLMRRSELGRALGPDDSPHDRIAAYVRSNSWRVGDVMTRDVVTIPPDCPLDHIAATMEKHQCKRLPVVRGGKLAGIVSRADLLRAILQVPKEDVIIGDDRLRIATMARIASDAGLGAFGLQVTVDDGHVTLKGEVQTAGQREAARVAAESVRGTSSVTNKIRLSGNTGKSGS